MISNKDLYLEEYYRSGVATEMAMRQEYEAWQAWEALMTWADDRIRQSEQFFLICVRKTSSPLHWLLKIRIPVMNTVGLWRVSRRWKGAKFLF